MMNSPVSSANSTFVGAAGASDFDADGSSDHVSRPTDSETGAWPYISEMRRVVAWSRRRLASASRWATFSRMSDVIRTAEPDAKATAPVGCGWVKSMTPLASSDVTSSACWARAASSACQAR